MEAMGTPTTEPGRPHVQGELLNTRLMLWGFHSALFWVCLFFFVFWDFFLFLFFCNFFKARKNVKLSRYDSVEDLEEVGKG